MAALLLPSVVIGAMAILLLEHYYDRFRVLDADKRFAYASSDAGRIGSSTIPTEALITIRYLTETTDRNRRDMLDSRITLDREIEAFEALLDEDSAPIFQPFREKLRLLVDGMRRYRIRVDNGKAVTAEVIDQYKPVSVTYLDIVGALRFEIDDALLSRELQLFLDLLVANEAGLVTNFYGTEYLRGHDLSAADLDLFSRATAVKDDALQRLSVRMASPGLKPLLDFESTPSGQWLRATAQAILHDKVAPSPELLRRWSLESDQRILFWKQGISAVIGEIRAAGDNLADQARTQLGSLVVATVVLSFILGFILLMAIKGVGLASRLLAERALLVDELRNAAQTDLLTGLFNRRGFEAMAREMLTRNELIRQMSVVIFDLDRFKQVNDIYGHDVGDIVLQRIGDLARGNFRNGDLLARHGGEEFVAVLPNSSLDAAADVAERVRQAIEATEFALDDGTVLQVTASFGCSSAVEPINEALLHDLVRRADLALYTAKFSGRNRVARDGDNDGLMFDRRVSRPA